MADYQCGCRCGTGTAQAGLNAELFYNWARALNRNAAGKYIDLTQAFDSVTRELHFASSTDDEAMLDAMLQDFGVPDKMRTSILVQAANSCDAG